MALSIQTGVLLLLLVAAVVALLTQVSSSAIGRRADGCGHRFSDPAVLIDDRHPLEPNAFRPSSTAIWLFPDSWHRRDASPIQEERFPHTTSAQDSAPLPLPSYRWRLLLCARRSSPGRNDGQMLRPSASETDRPSSYCVRYRWRSAH